MVLLPFHPKKKFLFSLLVFLSLFSLDTNLYSQVKIREKVGIKPTSTQLKLTKSATDYSPLEFQFGGPRPFSFTIDGPGGSFSGSNDGWGAPASFVSVPAINGKYAVSVSASPEFHTNVGYSVTWLNPQGYNEWISGYEMWFRFGGTKVDTFTFNRIPPPPPPFDFSVLLRSHVVFGTEASSIYFRYSGTVTDKSVTLNLEPSDPDVMFFDGLFQQSAGCTLTTNLDRSDLFAVQLNTVNTEYPKHVTVVARSNGIERTDTLLIEQPNSVRAYFEKENLSPGDTVNVIVVKVDNQFGWESDYPDTTHFEVGIKEGCGLGLIMDADGTKRDYFSSIKQPIRFVVADSIRVAADSVVLRVGAPVTGDEGVIAVSVIAFQNNTNKNKKTMTQNLSSQAEPSALIKKNIKAPDDNSCTVYTPIYKNIADAGASVEIGDDCEKNAKCKTTNPPVVPTFDLIPEPLIFTHNECTRDSMMRGGFGPPEFFENYAKQPTVKVCYNLTEKHWQINIEPANKILINYTLDFCYGNIRRMHKSPLFQITDVDTISILNIVKAYDDIESQRKYGGGGDYYVFEATVAHENVHKRDFIRIMNDLYNDDNVHFKADYLTFKPTCPEIKNEIEVLKSTQDHVKDWIKAFSLQLQFRWGLESDREGYEQNVQGDDSVQKVLTNYIQRLSI